MNSADRNSSLSLAGLFSPNVHFLEEAHWKICIKFWDGEVWTDWEPWICWFTPAEVPELHKKNPLRYMWISCLIISRIQILVVFLPQKADFDLWSALKPYQWMKFQVDHICINTKMVKLFAVFLLFTRIYLPWVGSITYFIHLNGLFGGGAEMMILRSLTSPEKRHGPFTYISWIAWWSSLPLSVKYKMGSSATCLRLTPLLQSHKEVFNIRHQFPWNVCVEAGLGFVLGRWRHRLIRSPWLDWI